MIRVVGLDLSLTRTGIAMTHTPGTGQLSVRTVASKDTGHERIWAICVAVAAACREQPDLAVIEGLYVGHHNNTLQLAELHGVIKQWLHHSGIPYALVAPQTRAVYATGSGRASKAEVLAAVQERYPIHMRTTDEADALILAAMAADHYGHPIVALPDGFRRALSSVDWPALPESPAPAGVTRSATGAGTGRTP